MRYILFLLFFSLVNCTSNPPGEEDYLIESEKVLEGIYYLELSIKQEVEAEVIKSAWLLQSGLLCEQSGYEIITVEERWDMADELDLFAILGSAAATAVTPGIMYIPASVKNKVYHPTQGGYLRCLNSTTGREAAIEYLLSAEKIQKDPDRKMQNILYHEIISENGCNRETVKLYEYEIIYEVSELLYRNEKFKEVPGCFQYLAEENEHIGSMRYLGILYKYGLGVDKSDELSEYWFGKAGL